MTIPRVLSIIGFSVAMIGALHAQENSKAAASSATKWTFDKEKIGSTPSGWRVAETGGTGKTGKWAVTNDNSAPSNPNVLQLKTEADGRTFNLCIAEGWSFRDFDLRVMVKGESGNVDQGGGPIWRCRDENNYYVCRINPLEGNFRVYKVVDGKRSQLGSADLETKTGQWYEVRALMEGNRIECYVDSKKLLEITDDTFESAGMVGLWTKADASSSFDDLVVGTVASLDASGINRAIGGTGTWIETEGVYKVTFPRDDVPVSVDGRKMEPFLGFTSWAAFQTGKAAEAMVMGDLVLFEDEVNPAMSAALESGIEVTALHNHFFFDEPRVYFMHIGGEGKDADLAAGVKNALDAARRVRTEHPQPRRTFGQKPVGQTNSVTAPKLDQILGVEGTSKDGMYKAVFGRTVQMGCGCEVGKSMGVNTWAAFAGTDEHALVDGDFAVLEHELQTVLKALRKSNINVVAIHHHMTGETPRMLFLHYWGVGKAKDLARGVKSALDAQSSVKDKPTP